MTGPLADVPAYADCRLIVPGCHDTASAVAGIPAAPTVDGDADWAYLSSGTWSLIGRVLDRPVATPAAFPPPGFTNLGAVGGGVLFHRNVNGLWLLQQSQATWAASGTPWAVADLVAAAETVPTPDGLIDLDDPDLLPPGDMPARINRQRSARGLPPVVDPPAVARLIFASLAARYAAVLVDVVALTGRPLRRLYAVGGGSQNDLLNRLTADATGLAVHRGPRREHHRRQPRRPARDRDRRPARRPHRRPLGDGLGPGDVPKCSKMFHNVPPQRAGTLVVLLLGDANSMAARNGGRHRLAT